jgi:hypothetical protein
MGYVVPDNHLEQSGRPIIYFWDACTKFGSELYRTWRWEVSTSLLIAAVAYGITVYDDPQARRNLVVTVEASAYVLGGFAVWHIIRTPLLIHRYTIKQERVSDNLGFGVLGLIALGALVVGIYHVAKIAIHRIVPDVNITIASADRGTKDATITQQQQVISELRKRPESCPKCGSAGSTPRLDILCQNLTDCPSAELAKRASELIAKLRAIMEPYNADVQRWENALRAEQVGTPAYNNMQARMDPSVRGAATMVMGKYRPLHTEVVAMREALLRRVGHSGKDEDYRYQIVGTGQGNPYMVDEIISELSTLTGEVRNLRQHE